MNKQKQTTKGHNSLAVTRGVRGQRESEMGKGPQLHGDAWHQTFAGEHDVVLTDIDL